MEDTKSRAQQHSKCNWIVTSICLLLIISLACLTSYLYIELKSLRGQFTQRSEYEVLDTNPSGGEDADSFIRNGRGRIQTFSSDGSGTTGSTGGDSDGLDGSGTTNPSTGRMGHVSGVSYVAYTHWGQRTCSGFGRQLFAGRQGIVTGFHNSQGNIVAGSDLLCVTQSDNHLQSDVQRGLRLQPALFDLFGHSDYFRQPNQGSQLFCVHCFVQGTDVQTQIGIDCVHPEWNELYIGFIVTSYDYSGTSQSICVDANSLPAQQHTTTNTQIFPVMSGSGDPFRESGKTVPCKVCFRKPSSPTRRDYDEGLEGPTGQTGAN